MKIMFDENMSMAILSEDRFEPCRVCGEPSSGWHCGAVTCEACKKFFLRSINGEDAKYRCVRSQECVIVRTTRTQCQYCRFQKCKEVGMTNSESPNSPTVAELFKTIACYVCGAPASGIHFGAITCEGCKGFFRRSIKERAPEKYRCTESGNCQINHNTRNMCRFCRYQQCTKVGMNPNNSRIGRQSNLFKHSILELKSRGLNNHINANYLLGHRKASKQRTVKSEGGTTTTTTTTTMTATNLSLVAAKSEFTLPPSSHLTPTAGTNNQMATRPNGSECEMLNLNYQQRTLQQTNLSNGGGNPICNNVTSGTTANGYHHQPAQQIIAVNQFTTNQYIINTGGQPVLGAQVPLPDNLMKLTTAAANTTWPPTTGGYYGMNSGAATSASPWYNSNDFNLDLNNNSIGQSGNLNQLSYTMPVPAIMPSQTSSSQLSLLPAPLQQQQLQPMQQQQQLQHVQPQPMSQSFEDDPKFDHETRDLIKTVYKSYIENMRPEILTDKSMIMPLKPSNYPRQQQALTYNGYPLQNTIHYQTADYETGSQSSAFHEILGYLSFYMRQYIKFLENIPEFNKLPNNDREELIRCSIHSVIAFAIYRGCDPTRVNYFNVDSVKFDKFTKVFPCFESSSVFMKKIREKFEKHRLDDKEIALYLATLSFITSSKNLEDYHLISTMREKLGNALRLYMTTRRNEEIVNDDILITLGFFKSFNCRLQNDLANQYSFKRDPSQLNDQYLLVEKLLMPSVLKQADYKN